MTIAERDQLVLAPDGEPIELVDPEDVSEYLFADSGAFRTDSLVVLPTPVSDEALAEVDAHNTDLATLADWDRSLVYFYRFEQNRQDRVASSDGTEES